MVSVHTLHHYVDAYLSPQLGNFLFQDPDPLLVSITFEFNLFSIPSYGTVFESLLGGFVRLQDVYKLPFLPPNLIFCRSLAGITIEWWFYSLLFSLRFGREPGRRRKILFYK
jgi:hypothetical protein